MAYPEGPKVLMIGIDAGDIHLIRSSLGKLPRLRQLFSDGCVFRLGSPADTLSSAVWPTFSTGALPGEHGAYYPMQWDPASMQLRRLSPDWIDYEPFWYELARQGRQVTALDVPFSLASKLERGVEVQNWGSQECLGPFSSNRPELAREVKRRFGAHPMGAEIPVEEPTAKLEAMRKNLVAGARRKGELSRWLMETTEWDLFLTVFGECHRGGHLFWPEPLGRHTPVPADALSDVYQAVDQAIGHILEGVDLQSTTVAVFSLHGTAANYTQEHFVLPLMERINAAFDGGYTPEAEPAASKRNPIRMLREAVPPQLQQAIARAVPAAGRDWVVKRAFLGGLDWRHTLGFALPASGEGYLRFNLAGREAAGVVDRQSERHLRYREFLRESLFSFKDAATHAPIVKDVAFTGELYPGPRSDYLPDAVIVWSDAPPAEEIYSERLGRLTGKLTTGRTGDHQPEGFAVVAGDTRRLEHAPPLEHTAGFANFVRHLLARAATA